MGCDKVAAAAPSDRISQVIPAKRSGLREEPRRRSPATPGADDDPPLPPCQPLYWYHTLPPPHRFFSAAAMPITLKLSRPQRPAGAAVASGEGSSPLASSGDAGASSPSPALASPSRRTVSFSQQQQQQQQRYELSPSPATPFRTGAGAEWSTARNVASNSQLPKRADGALASTSSSAPAAQPRRSRSPTPPSSAYMLALPLKGSRASVTSGPLDASTLSQTLAHLITRYAALAGYAAIDPAALDYLQESIDVYIESVLLQSLESALLGGRTDPSVRDVLGGLSWREQEEDEERDEDEEEEQRADKDTQESKESDELKQLPTLARYVSRLISWRHNVPDYYDERTPAAVADVDASGRWAKSIEVDAFLVTGADEKNEDELLTRKTRFLEKSQRDEIPSHLPELPAVHTWRRSAETPPAGDAPASTTLSRLETRLVSSRLVQSSLGSLIGKLEGVGSAGLSSPALQDGQESAATDLPATVTQASKVKEDMTPSSSPTTATAPPLSRAGNRSLSVRLRPQSVSSISAFAAPESPAATGEPATKRRRGLSEYDHTLHLDFRGGHAQPGFPASPLGLTTPGSASATHIGAFNFPLQQHRRAGSLAVSPAVSTPGLGGMAGAGGYPWSHPLMSPVTPLSASGPGGRYFPMAGPPPPGSSTGATQEWAGDLGTRRTSSALQSPSLTHFDLGAAAGEGGETLSAGMTILPPIVNFKAGWYAKKG